MARRRLFNQCFYITYEGTKYFPCIEIFSTLPMATANLAPEGGEFVFSLTSSHVWEVAAALSHPFFNIIEVDGVAVTTPKVTGESGTHVIKVRVNANSGTNPRQSKLYITQFLNKDHMSAATGSLFSGDLYSRRITMNVFEQGSGAYVLIDNRTEFTENISYDTTSRQYTITSRGGWHFVDASVGQSCTSNITGVTTTDEDSTDITVTYGQNAGGSDREFLFQIVSNQDSSIMALGIVTQAGLVILDLLREDNDTLPWVGTNLDDATTWPSLPQYYSYLYRYGHPGQGYVYTYSGSNLINVTANTPVNLTLPSKISVSENPITGSGSYIKQISFSGAALDSGLTDITGYTYLMSGVSSVDSSVQDTVSFHYEAWPYIELAPKTVISPGGPAVVEADSTSDYSIIDANTIEVSSACTGFTFRVESNYNVRISPNQDSIDIFDYNFYPESNACQIAFKNSPETSSTDVPRGINFVVSGLVGPVVVRRFNIVRKAAQHTITHYFEVLPATATISSAGTLQLKAWYHTVTDGVDGEPEDVTTSTTWVDMSDIPNPFFTVGRNTGLVTGTNTIENAQTGRIVATYNTYTGETSITVLGTGTTTYYLEVTPATATIGPTGTTNLTAKFYTVINGVPDTGTDVTSLAVWSSDNTAATVSAGVVTGHNNNPNSSAVANITATYNGYSDDSEITVQPAVITYNYFIIRPEGSIRLSTGDTVNGQPVSAKITKYINGVEAETLDVTNATTWGVSDSSVITAGTAGSNPQHVYPVYESGTYYPNDRTAELLGTYVIDGQTFQGAQTFYVSPEGRVEYLLTVRPQSTSLALNETQRLTVMYYTITDGVSDAGVNVTNLATYSNYDTSLITVSSNGLITDINAGSEASTTITVAYGNADNVTVSVLTRDTQTTHALVLSPASDSCTVSGNVQYTLVYITYVNGTETDRQTLSPSTAITWDITDDDNVANFNISNNNMFIENLTTSDSYVSVQAVYQGVSSNVASVTAYGATSIERYLRIEPDEDPISYTGSTQLYVSAVTDVNGSQYKVVSIDARWVTWSHDGQSINLDNTGYIVANNTAHTDEVINISGVYHAHAYDEATGTTTLTVEAKPDEVDYRIDLFLNGKANETVAWNGTIYITAELYKEVNGVKTETISALTTADGLLWTVSANTGYGTGDDATWDPTTQILAGHNLSNRTSTWNCTASYTFRSGGTTVYVVSHNHSANFTSASSIVRDVVVSAGSASVTYSGSTPVSATYVTIVENVIYEPASVDITTDASTVWSVIPNGYGSVSNGTFYGNNATNAAQTVTVTATYNNLSDSVDITVEAKPDVVEYGLRLLQNGDSDLSQSFDWDGLDVFTIMLSKFVNGVWVEDIREITTTGDGVTWTVAYPYPEQHADEYTTWDDNTQTLQGHNLSNQRITVNVSAAWGTSSARYTTHVATVQFNAPSSIEYGLIVDADSYSVAYNGSTPVSATYVTIVEGDVYEPASVDVTTDAGTVWSVSPTSYGSVSNGTFYGNNATDAAQTVTVTATYNNLSDSVDITVGTDTVSHRLVVVSADDQVVYNGSTQLTATYQTLVGGVVYSQENVTANPGLSWSVNSEYASVTGSSVFQANNTTHTNITVTVTGTYLSETGATTIEILGKPDDITYGLLLVASTGSTSWNGEVGLTPYHLTYVNGVEDPARRVELNGSDVVWFVDDQNTGIATLKQNIPSIEMENLTNSNVLVTVYFTYDGMTANTVNINVGHASVTYRFDVRSNLYTIDYNGQALLTGFLVTIVNGTDYREESIAPENVTWSDDSIYASVTNGVLTANNNTNTAQTVTVTGTYNGLTGNAEIVIGRQPANYTQELVLSPATSTISNYYGSVDFTATYRLFDNGVLYLEKIVDGGEVSTNDWNITVTPGLGANISQSTTTGTTATLNVNNTSDRNGTASVTLSYTYSEAGLPVLPAVTSNVAMVSVARKPVVSYGLEITPAQPETQPYSGSLQFTAWYCTYEDGVPTTSVDVTSNAVWSVSSTDGDFVHLGVNGDLVEFVNLDSDTRTVTVNASYTVGNDTYTDSVQFDVDGVDITTTVTLTPADTTVAYGNTVDYQAVVTISHNNVQKYSATITNANFDSNTMSISSDKATYAVVAGTPMRFLNNNNTSSDETATITFTWEEGTPTYLPANTVLTAQTAAEVVKQVIISYEFEITPKQSELGTQPYSDSLPFTAKLWTCENGTRISSVDVTSNVSTTWSCTDVYGNLSVLNMDNDIKGLVHFVNLTTGASNTGRVTVSASYGNYSDSVTFDVSGLNSLTYDIKLLPEGVIANYQDNIDYTAEVTIYHNGESVYHFIYYLAGGDSYYTDGHEAFSCESELFLQNGDYPCRFYNDNKGETDIQTTVNFIWGDAPDLIPAGEILEDFVTVTLKAAGVTPTYSTTFTAVSPANIDTVSYRLNGGAVQSNNTVSVWTVNQLNYNNTITWSAVTAGYVTKTGTTTITGNNAIPIDMTPNQFSFGIAPKDSDDTNVNVFGVSVSTTNGYSNNFMMRCSGTGYTQVMTLPANYITDDNDVFTFVVTRGDGVARIYDWRSTGSLAFTGVDPTDLNDMLQNIGFSYATNINLKYNGQYTYGGDIVFKIANAPVGFDMDCTIYRSTTSAHSPGTNSAVTVPNEYIVLDEGYLCPFDCNALDTTQYYRYVAYTYTGDAAVSSGWITPTLTVREDGEYGTILYTGPVSGCNLQLTDRDMEGTWWILTSNN